MQSELIIYGIQISLGLVVAALNFYLIYYFLDKYFRNREDMKALYQLCMGLFFILNFASMVVKITFMRVNSSIPIYLSGIIEFIYTIITLISLMILMYAVELEIWNKKTKFLITISYIAYLVIYTIAVILANFAINFLLFLVGFIMTYILVSIIPIAYFYVASKSVGEIRTTALTFGIGFMLIMIGAATQTTNLMKFNPAFFIIPMNYFTTNVISYIIIMCGFIIIITGIQISKASEN